MPPDRTSTTSQLFSAVAANPGTRALSSHGPQHLPSLERGKGKGGMARMPAAVADLALLRSLPSLSLAQGNILSGGLTRAMRIENES